MAVTLELITKMMTLAANPTTPREEAASAAIAACRHLMARPTEELQQFAAETGNIEGPAAWELQDQDPHGVHPEDAVLERYTRHELQVEVQLRRGVMPPQLETAIRSWSTILGSFTSHDVTVSQSKLSPTRATVRMSRRGSGKIHPIDAQGFVKDLQVVLVDDPDIGYVHSFVYREAGTKL
jgi:hypothetical protein